MAESTTPNDRPMVDYSGRTVLITGGTGSFGSTMTRHLLESGVDEVRILSRDEAKQHDMRIRFGDRRLLFHVGDVRDERSVRKATAGCDLVFHAAALKQVPTCEFFPMQAVATNVTGSANVIEAAQDLGVEAVVCLSTDKAVFPVNAMGMTKAMMEKVASAASRSGGDTTVSIVRYGNVLYSRGSVVPLFIDQIVRGQPLTITDPTMTRFLMPLSQCVELVEFAFFNSSPGDTFVRKAPAATIADLAAAVIEIFDSDASTRIIGARHGEKLFETLASADELQSAVDMGEYWRIPTDSRDLNYAEYFEIGDPDHSFAGDFHSHNAERLDRQQVKELLLSLPEIQAVLHDRTSS